jgi:hypothetical protein
MLVVGVRHEVTLRNTSASPIELTEVSIYPGTVSGTRLLPPLDLSPLLPNQERQVRLTCNDLAISFALKVTYQAQGASWLRNTLFMCDNVVTNATTNPVSGANAFPLAPLDDSGGQDIPTDPNAVDRDPPLPPGDPGQGGTTFLTGAVSCLGNVGTTQIQVASTLAPGTPITATINGNATTVATVNAGGLIFLEAFTPFANPASISVTAGGVTDSLSLACTFI